MRAEANIEAAPTLVITADDYGYRSAYDAGIVLAAHAATVDRVSVMATRNCDPDPLVQTGVTIGLHLEPDTSIADQLRRFDTLFGHPPRFLDGHRHCHIEPRIAAVVVPVALELDVPVRAINPPHRAQLRNAGVRTTDRLVGRLFEHHAALPLEIERWRSGDRIPPGTTEWFVHPGYRDPESGSSYDEGRPEDLALLLALGDRERWQAAGIERSALTVSR